MYNTDKELEELVNTVREEGQTPFILSGNSKSEILHAVRHETDIHHWIFSGGTQAVIDPETPQVPLELFDRADKTILCICYSMESVCVQLGLPIERRRVNKEGPVRLSVESPYRTHPLFSGLSNPMLVRRNHRFYFRDGATGTATRTPVVPVASYDGELMLALYKNAVLTQYHPERTKDGRDFLQNWLYLF